MMRLWLTIGFIAVGTFLAYIVVDIYQHASKAPEPRSFYPALDQFVDTDEKLVRWLDSDTGVICYARSGAYTSLSCVPLRAQSMP